MRQIISAKSMEEAYRLRRDLPEARYVSGGTEVLRLNGSVPDATALIDVSAFLSPEIEKKHDAIIIGAGATFQDLIDSPVIPLWLKEACGYMPSLALRMQATIGGNIARLGDDSYLIPVLLAAGARLKTYGNRGMLEGELSEYVRNGGSRYTVLGLIIPADEAVSSARFSRTAASHSAVNMALSKRGLFSAVKGGGIYFSFEEALCADIADDITGSAQYKKYLIRTEKERLEEVLND